jgi:hypothetical protein
LKICYDGDGFIFSVLLIIAKMDVLVNQWAISLIALALGLAALIWVVFLSFRYRRLVKFQNEFFQGKTGADLEEVIVAHNEQLHRLISELRELGRQHKELAALQELAVQRVGLVRFNSFSESGGSNSFSLALLNAQGRGAVITSLFGRDSQRVYVKPIEAGDSKIPLTEEEKQAIMESQNVFVAPTVKEKTAGPTQRRVSKS